MKIEVCGMGCAKCERLEENARKAVKELKSDAKVVKVSDMDQIVEKGVMLTPALLIDGEPAAVGRVPSVEEIKQMISKKKERK